MNWKAIVPLVAGLCIGGLALKLGLNSLQKAQGSQAASVAVFAAKEDVPRGTAIDESMLQQVYFPPKLIPAGAFKEKTGLLGRVPRMGAPGGLPILESMLLPPGVKAGIYVKAGFRAVAVKIDESSGVDYHLEPGCFVDVVGFYNIRGNKQETIARTLLENVEVAAVGQRISATEQGEDKSGKKGSGGPPPKPARAVTLFVKPEDVPKLHIAEQRGKLKLSLRSTDDGSALGRDVTAREDELLGPLAGGGEKPEKKSDDTMSKFLAMFQQKPGHQKPAPKPADVDAPPPAPPPPAWKMTVVNENEMVVLGWQQMDSIESFEISREGGKSRGRPRAPGLNALAPSFTAMAAPPAATPPQPAQPEPEQSQQPDEPEQSEPEPEEL